MPGTFLTTAERERLSRFPDAVSYPDLMIYFALSHNDQAFIDPYRSDANRLGVALQLCSMRYLGFCPVQISTAPQEVIRYLAAQLHVSSETLGAYGSRAKTRQGHVQEVLSYLGFRRFQPDDQEALQAWLLERALEHDKPTLLLHMACEHLKQQQVMRPGVTILERLVVAARVQAHHESFRRLHPLFGLLTRFEDIGANRLIILGTKIDIAP
jgi:TnpA family transposase